MLVAFVRVFSAFYTLLLSWTVEKKGAQKYWIERTEQRQSVETITQWLRIARFLIIYILCLLSFVVWCFWCVIFLRFCVAGASTRSATETRLSTFFNFLLQDCFATKSRKNSEFSILFVFYFGLNYFYRASFLLCACFLVAVVVVGITPLALATREKRQKI